MCGFVENFATKNKAADEKPLEKLQESVKFCPTSRAKIRFHPPGRARVKSLSAVKKEAGKKRKLGSKNIDTTTSFQTTK